MIFHKKLVKIIEGAVKNGTTAATDIILKKMDEAEARRNREFTYQMKELEFYKSNYDKELKEIFDYWFDVARLTQIKNNPKLTDDEKNDFEKQYNELVKIGTIAKYKLNTLKYGGQETSRIFAFQGLLMQKKYADMPKTANLYIWCAILSVLKHEILGQYIDPIYILQIFINDYDDNKEKFEESKEYISKVYKDIYGEKPYWIQ